MKKIFIVGGNGFARECHNLLTYVESVDNTVKFGGFLGYKTKEFGEIEEESYKKYYICDVEDYQFGENDYAIIGSGDVHLRKKIYAELKSKGIKFYTLISPRAVVYNPQNIGEGCMISNFVIIAEDVQIGICNVINSLSAIGHDVKIGNFNIISSHADICGYTIIGDNNFLGSRCSTLPHSIIGNNNKIAAGSVVVKRCKDNCVMQGNPAVKICNVEDL